MPNGTSSQDCDRKCHLDIDHIPVGSEETHLSETAALTITKTSRKEICLRLWLECGYDGDYFDVASLVEQALISCLPDGCWRGKRGPFGQTELFSE